MKKLDMPCSDKGCYIPGSVSTMTDLRSMRTPEKYIENRNAYLIF